MIKIQIGVNHISCNAIEKVPEHTDNTSCLMIFKLKVIFQCSPVGFKNASVLDMITFKAAHKSVHIYSICTTEEGVFKIPLFIADSAHFESVSPSFCRFTSYCNALCYFVRGNYMIHADRYRCRIHVMYFRFFFFCS